MNPLVLEDHAGEEGEGWLDLLHGGHDSVLYKYNRFSFFEGILKLWIRDLQDYFCYVQIEKGATELRDKVQAQLNFWYQS